jgi:hypothetical protein
MLVQAACARERGAVRRLRSSTPTAGRPYAGCTSPPGCTTAARSRRPSTWSTRPPSWRRSTTASTRCAPASRCSSATPRSHLALAWPKAATKRARRARHAGRPPRRRVRLRRRCNMSAANSDGRTSRRACGHRARRWQRTLDDRLGLSARGTARKAPAGRPAAGRGSPCWPTSPEHRIAATGRTDRCRDNRWGFRLHVPELLYNRGELHNLSRQRAAP